MPTVDWYRNVSLVTFFAGCNFRCPYCENPRFIPHDSVVDTSLGAIKNIIEMNRSLLDSVVFTGGESLLKSAPVIESSKAARRLGLKVMVSDNGSCPKNLERPVPEGVAGRVALDLRAPLSEETYGNVSGLHGMGATIVRSLEDSIRICWSSDVELEIRTIVEPTPTDDPSFIKRIASLIKGKCDIYYLQQFDNLGEVLDPSMKRLNPPSIDLMKPLARIAVDEGVENLYFKTRESGLKRMGEDWSNLF